MLIVNGSGFDSVYGKGHARIVFLPPIEELNAACNALEALMRKAKTKSRFQHLKSIPQPSTYNLDREIH